MIVVNNTVIAILNFFSKPLLLTFIETSLKNDIWDMKNEPRRLGVTDATENTAQLVRSYSANEIKMK